MRTEISKLLNKVKELHAELIGNYSEILPQNIIDGGNRTIEEDIPNKINAILSILNMAEKEEKYAPIKNIDEAINLFNEENIQESIDKAIANKNLVGFSSLKNEKLNVAEILENARFGIESGAQIISMQIVAGKLSKNGGLME
ncbi:hypothetical protein [Bizionia sp.]|uniref:hypothetical protein n=1 Tax=Bizionia sp. TaxID=1954480 RepID=UPI003A8F9639